MMRILSLGTTIGGQAVWALAQAAVVIVLSGQGNHALIGVYTLGLAVFAPLCLVGSLNLRTTIALGLEASVPSRQALVLRAASVALALIVTFAVLAAASVSFTQWLTASLLVGIRAVDQLSDVTTGFYQRDNKQDLIARSFAIRGAANIAPFLALSFLTHNAAVAAGAALVVTLGLAFWHDLGPMMANSDRVGDSSWREGLRLARRSALVAPYPIFDNLHFNSFRFAVFLNSTQELMGFVGVAQTLFAPFQLLASAINLHYLPRVAEAVKAPNPTAVRRELIRGTLVGLAMTGLFLIMSCFIPDFVARILFGEDALRGVAIVRLVAIAMMPVVAVGFAASCQVAAGRTRTYSIAPILGLATFGGFVLVLGASGMGTITTAFVTSYIIRYSFTAMFAARRNPVLHQPSKLPAFTAE